MAIAQNSWSDWKVTSWLKEAVDTGEIPRYRYASFGPRSAKKRRGDPMRAIFKTDRGKVRQHNEDNGGIFKNSEGVRLAIVADG